MDLNGSPRESGLKRISAALRGEFSGCAPAFLATLAFGLLAQMPALTSKLPVDDDIPFLFGKGATTVSGRYGLELLRLIFPDYSMPWLYGLINLLLVSAAVCVVIRLFDIRSRALQILLGGLFISFPSETALMGYMFTSAPYALVLLTAALAVFVFDRGLKWRWLVSPLLLLFTCSVYQGYFAFAAAFCVILMIKRLLRQDCSAGEVFRYGLKLLAMLLAALALYGLLVLVFSKAMGYPLIDATNRSQSLPMRIAVAYSAYLNTVVKGYFGFVNSGLSLLMHLVLLALSAYALIYTRLCSRDTRRTLLLFLCLALLPLSSYCLFMLADNGYLHALALYSFASLYVLICVLLDTLSPAGRVLCRRLALGAMALIIANNIYFANEFHLYSYLQYENMYSRYTAMAAQITAVPGFDEDSRLAVVGENSALLFDQESVFDFEKFTLPGNNITDSAHTQLLLRYYLGFDIPFADEAELRRICETEQFSQMAVYPYYGSIAEIDGCIVVRLE